MIDKKSLKPVALAIGTTFAASLAGTSVANAADNPFGMTKLSSGYLVAEEAEGKCGGKKAEDEGKCGEGKCGEGKGAHTHKAGVEGKCGEGKCGEGKCGEGKGAHIHKAGVEGKCGEAKCGGKK
jgi:uncharacterized low-complexity protein